MTDPDAPPPFDRRTLRRLLVAAICVTVVVGVAAGCLGRHRIRAAFDRWRADALLARGDQWRAGGRPLTDAEHAEALRLAATLSWSDRIGPFYALLAAARTADDARLDRVEAVALGWVDDPAAHARYDVWFLEAESHVRRSGVMVLAECRPRNLGRLQALADSPDLGVRRTARMAVFDLGQRLTGSLLADLSERRPLTAVEFDQLVGLSRTGADPVDRQAVMVLGKAALLDPDLRPRIRPLLAELIADPERSKRQAEAAEALARLEAADVRP